MVTAVTALNSMFNMNILIHSFTSIAITLSGMIITSLLFEYAIKQKEVHHIPFVLLSSIILGFKGNVELGYAMHLSTLRRYSTTRRFWKIALVNSCLLVVESFGVGVLSGIIGIIYVSVDERKNLKNALSVSAVSIIACFISTLIFIGVFLITLEIVTCISADPENILLPILNVVNDILVVKFLLLFSRSFHRSHIKIHMLIILTTSVIVGICSIYLLAAENLLPLQNIEVAIFTLSFNIFAGFVLERASNLSPMVPPAFPVFTGMSTSITLIYLHHLFTASFNDSRAIPKYLRGSLGLISLLTVMLYLSIARATYVPYSVSFALSFIVMFILQVMLLMETARWITKLAKNRNMNISSNVIPIMTAISDFTGSVILMLISVFISHE